LRRYRWQRSRACNREAIRLGAQDYLTKPFSDRVFLMRLQRLLRPAREKPPTPSSDDLYI
jgi:DNA-binding response OmpR family regulator